MVNQEKVKEALLILEDEATQIANHDEFIEVMDSLEKIKEILQMS